MSTDGTPRPITRRATGDDPESTVPSCEGANSDSRMAGGSTVAGAEHVLLEIGDRIAVIRINDPERRNAITPATSASLRSAVRRAEADPDVHVLIVTGAGSAFCAGADRTALKTADEDRLRQMYEGFLAVADCILPTIAAVNGPAVGAGLNLALACDVRIAGPRAVFDPRFLALGIHPGGGATWMLQRAVGPALARTAILFGMKFDADTAVRHGLALTVADDAVAAAVELAAGLRSAPRDLVIATKATMRSTINPGSVDTEMHAAAVAIEMGPQVQSIQSLGNAGSP
jgi:enoyl-CoA hydratase